MMDYEFLTNRIRDCICRNCGKKYEACVTEYNELCRECESASEKNSHDNVEELVMQWYSVKKYRPYSDGTCLVRTENGDVYAAEWRGSSCDMGHLENEAVYSYGWMMETLCEDSTCDTKGCEVPSSVEIFGVTHFLIPAPVTIE